MKLFTRLLAAVILLVSASAANAEENPQVAGYKGADAGRLALSMALPQSFSAQVVIKRLAPLGQAAISDERSWLKPSHDFSGEGPDTLTGPLVQAGYSYHFRNSFKGDVFVETLPPGHYLITDVWSGGQIGSLSYTQPYNDLAIPFDIEAGKTTYLGEFGFWNLAAKGLLGLKSNGGWLLTIRDQSARDFPIAKTRFGDLGEVVTSIPDVARLNNPLIQAAP
jgi:hypothetical protein